MKETTLTGITIALASGLAVGIQATLFAVMGRSIGPVRTSLILNVTGGVIAGLIMIGIFGVMGNEHWNIPKSTLVFAVIAVTLGIFIISGVSLAFQKTGVAVGIAAVFAGQMLIGIVVDALGLVGSESVPVDSRRLLGLAIMVIAIALLVHQR